VGFFSHTKRVLRLLHSFPLSFLSTTCHLVAPPWQQLSRPTRTWRPRMRSQD
jgi:hypothetical protein